MKIRFRPFTRHRVAFTLTEVMVASAIFSIAMGSFLMVQLFGMRMHMLSRAKLTASDDARRVMTTLANEIKSCKLVSVRASA